MQTELTPVEEWAAHGVISQAMAQGTAEHWIRKQLKLIGVFVTHFDVERMIQEWEERAMEDAWVASHTVFN